jgi:hypothetical protein
MGNDDDIVYTIGTSGMDTTWTNTSSPVTISSEDSGTFTLNLDDYSSSDLDIDTVIAMQKVEFVDVMPELYKINQMCEHYPALQKAFENFKTVYAMVKQDYKGNYEEEDIPF